MSFSAVPHRNSQLFFRFAGPLETDPIIAAALTAKDKERRAALLADSPDLSTRPPPESFSVANSSTASTLSRKLVCGVNSLERGDDNQSLNSSTGFPRERSAVIRPQGVLKDPITENYFICCCCPKGKWQNTKSDSALNRLTDR